MFFGVSIKFIFALLSTVIVIFGGFFPYFLDIFRKRTKPHAYTWLIWSVTYGTALAGLWYGKGGLECPTFVMWDCPRVYCIFAFAQVWDKEYYKGRYCDIHRRFARHHCMVATTESIAINVYGFNY